MKNIIDKLLVPSPEIKKNKNFIKLSAQADNALKPNNQKNIWIDGIEYPKEIEVRIFGKGGADNNYMVTNDFALDHLVDWLDLTSYNKTLMQKKDGVYLPLDDHKLKLQIQKSELFKEKRLSTWIGDNTYRKLLFKTVELPTMSQRGINLGGVNWIIDSEFNVTKTKELKNFKIKSKIKVENLEDISDLPYWTQLCEKYFKSPVDDVNFVLSSLFWTKDIIKKMRKLIVWDSNGDLGKTQLINELLTCFENKNSRGILVREYTKGTMGASINAWQSSVNIIDDKPGLLTTEFANDHTLHKFVSKNIGANMEEIESYFTTIVLSNGTDAQMNDTNSYKKVHVLHSNNLRYSEEEQMQELYGKLNKKELFKYIFKWFIQKVEDKTLFDYVNLGNEKNLKRQRTDIKLSDHQEDIIDKMENYFYNINEAHHKYEFFTFTQINEVLRLGVNIKARKGQEFEDKQIYIKWLNDNMYKKREGNSHKWRSWRLSELADLETSENKRFKFTQLHKRYLKGFEEWKLEN